MSGDKAAIADLLHKYFRVLDERQLDDATLAEIFSDGGEMTRPNGATTRGPAAIAAAHRASMARFRATQHLTSGCEVDVRAEVATFRVNIVAMHLWAAGEGDPSQRGDDNHFLAGGVVTGEAERTAAGWRIRRVQNAVTWRTGVGFAAMLRIGTDEAR